MKARACCSTCGRFRRWLEMGATPSDTLPTRGTSRDHREGAVRCRAYTPGSTDRQLVVALLKWASAKRCEGWGLRDLSCSHRGYWFCGAKVFSKLETFLPLPAFFDPRGPMGFLRDASFSRNLQSDPGQCRTMQNNPEESRERQDAAEQSKMFQGIPGSNRKKQIHPGQCRDAQEDTGSVATARWSFV